MLNYLMLDFMLRNSDRRKYKGDMGDRYGRHKTHGVMVGDMLNIY